MKGIMTDRLCETLFKEIYKYAEQKPLKIVEIITDDQKQLNIYYPKRHVVKLRFSKCSKYLTFISLEIMGCVFVASSKPDHYDNANMICNRICSTFEDRYKEYNDAIQRYFSITKACRH